LAFGGTAFYGTDWVFDSNSDVKFQSFDTSTGTGVATVDYSSICVYTAVGIIDTSSAFGLEHRPDATIELGSGCLDAFAITTECGGITLDIVNPTLPIITNEQVSGSAFQFTLLDDPYLDESYCTVFGSTNLLIWTNLGPVFMANGVGTFVDTDYTNNPNRFYTAMQGDVSGDPIVSNVPSGGGGGSDNSDAIKGSGGFHSVGMAQPPGSAVLPTPPLGTIYGANGTLINRPPPPPGTTYGPNGSLQRLPP
jgi:hypothetical protein